MTISVNSIICGMLQDLLGLFKADILTLPFGTHLKFCRQSDTGPHQYYCFKVINVSQILQVPLVQRVGVAALLSLGGGVHRLVSLHPLLGHPDGLGPPGR